MGLHNALSKDLAAIRAAQQNVRPEYQVPEEITVIPIQFPDGTWNVPATSEAEAEFRQRLMQQQTQSEQGKMVLQHELAMQRMQIMAQISAPPPQALRVIQRQFEPPTYIRVIDNSTGEEFIRTMSPLAICSSDIQALLRNQSSRFWNFLSMCFGQAVEVIQ